MPLSLSRVFRLGAESLRYALSTSLQAPWQKLTDRASRLFRRCAVFFPRVAQQTWRSIPKYLTFYVLVVVVIYAAWEGRRPVFVIPPFQFPTDNKLPFNGATAASVLRDAFVSFHDEAKAQLQTPAGDVVPVGPRGLTVLKPAEFKHFRVASHYSVEVKGLSHEALISLARQILGKEEVISGDVVVEDAQFRLLARSTSAGPWNSELQPPTADGLQQACRQLAVQFMTALEPRVLGLALFREARYVAAVDAFRRALELDRDSPDAHNELAVALARTGRFGESIARFNKALTLRPDFHQAYFNLGNALYGKGDFEGAIAAYNMALGLRPKWPEALNNLGSALARRGDFSGAIAAYRKALGLLPEDPELLLNLGNALYASKSFDEAIVAYRALAAVAPDWSRAHYNLGTTHHRLGHLDEAIDSYRKALELQEAFPEAQNNLGAALGEKGHYAEAVSHLRRGLALRPDYAEAHDSLGTVFWRMAKYAAAVSAYRRAVALKPGSPEMRYNLGLALKKAHREIQGQREIRQAWNVNPNLNPPPEGPFR